MKLQHTRRQWVSVELADLVLVPAGTLPLEFIWDVVGHGDTIAHYQHGEITVPWRD